MTELLLFAEYLLLYEYNGMNSNKSKADEFLKWAVENERELKTNLAKNITYDADIFEDAYNETLIKCYRSILKNGVEIKNKKTYFFTACKWTYVLFQNRKRKAQEQHVRNYFDDERNEVCDDNTDYEDRFNRSVEAIEQIKEILAQNFTQEQINIFITYLQKNTERKCSYNKLSAMLGVKKEYIGDTVKKIRKYIENNEEVHIIRNKYYSEND